MKSLFTFIFLFFVFNAFTQPGTLDQTFNDSGKVHYTNTISCIAAALQGDGKILAGGASVNSKYAVARYLTSGDVDSSFGINGTAKVNNGLGLLFSVSVLSNGKIISSGSLNGSLAAVQFKTNGTADSSFGNNGISFLGFDARCNSIVQQSDGKIVLGGIIGYGLDSPYHMLLLRLNTNGSLDTTFGDTGIVINRKGYEIKCLAVQQDGKIIAAGNKIETGSGQDQFVISRYNTDGSLDDDFGTHGNVFTDITSGDDEANAIVLLANGKIVAAGEANNSLSLAYSYMAAVKYNTDGTLDNSFGNNGFAKILFDNNYAQPTGLLLQSDGKLVLTGSVYNYNLQNNIPSNFALARLKSNGIIDSSFALNGKQVTGFGSEAASSASLLQPDGKIILTGNALYDTTLDIILARYNNDVQNKNPIARIKRWIEHHILHWQNLQSSANNAAYYTIEQSNSAVSGFMQVAKIKSSSINNIYNYALPLAANNSLQAISYYRINAVDNSGNITASAVVSDAETEAAALSVYPNPVKNLLHIKGLQLNTKYEVRIANEKGNVVAAASIINNASYNCNVQSLSKGVYYLTLTSSHNKISTIKFVKE